MSSGSVKDFYSNKTVFITGAMGYIGRLTLAKLMRLGNVREILLLSRPKKGKTNAERLDKVLSGFLFEQLEYYDASFRSKLRLINGDMEVEGLGMSREDRDYINNQVEIIIHGAATVRFDEQLKKAITINVRGTRDLLEMATEAKNLKSFVHISTAYTQCPRSEIKESFYMPPVDYREAIKFLNIDDEILDALTARLVAPWPNTYAYTKAISEDLIRHFQDRLPIAIIRPTIVVSTMKDPVPGFSDTILGVLGIGVGAGLGIIRVAKAYNKSAMDMVPSDVVVNMLLVVAWQTSKKLKNEKIEIYNCISGEINRCSNSYLTETIINHLKTYPLAKMIWLPKMTVCSSQLMFRLLFFLYQYVPAFFIDIILHFKGSTFRLVPLYSKIFYYEKLLTYFAERTWKFHDDNRMKLEQAMSKTDELDFPFRIDPVEFQSMYESCTMGLSKYFFKETEEDLEMARRKYKILYIVYHSIFAVFYSCCFYLFYRILGGYYLRLLPMKETV